MKTVIKMQDGIVYSKYMTHRAILNELEREVSRDEYDLINVPCTLVEEEGRIVSSVPHRPPEIMGDIEYPEPETGTDPVDKLRADLDYTMMMTGVI